MEAGNFGLAVYGREKGKEILVLSSISATVAIRDKPKDKKVVSNFLVFYSFFLFVLSSQLLVFYLWKSLELKSELLPPR